MGCMGMMICGDASNHGMLGTARRAAGASVVSLGPTRREETTRRMADDEDREIDDVRGRDVHSLTARHRSERRLPTGGVTSRAAGPPGLGAEGNSEGRPRRAGPARRLMARSTEPWVAVRTYHPLSRMTSAPLGSGSQADSTSKTRPRGPLRDQPYWRRGCGPTEERARPSEGDEAP
jgi:hypothetical protein